LGLAKVPFTSFSSPPQPQEHTTHAATALVFIDVIVAVDQQAESRRKAKNRGNELSWLLLLLFFFFHFFFFLLLLLLLGLLLSTE